MIFTLSKLKIREYQPEDIGAVRRICVESAGKANRVGGILRYPEFASDFTAMYHTDYESQNIIVAEYEGDVIGYVLGNFDKSNYKIKMLIKIIPKILTRIVLNRGVFSKGGLKLIIAFVWSLVLLLIHKPVFHKGCIARLHIAVDDGFRGKSIGFRLLGYFMEKAVLSGVGGIRVSVDSGNLSAIGLFKKYGFDIIGGYQVILPDSKGFKNYPVLLLTKIL